MACGMGKITPRGAAAAERSQARISSEEHQDRAADGGHLTAQDRHQIARQQNRTSQGIYIRNHNQYTDPGVAPKLYWNEWTERARRRCRALLR